MAPHSVLVDEDLNKAAKVMDKMKSENEAALDYKFLQQYAIDDKEGEFEKALQNGVNVSAAGLISVIASPDKLGKSGKLMTDLDRTK